MPCSMDHKEKERSITVIHVTSDAFSDIPQPGESEKASPQWGRGRAQAQASGWVGLFSKLVPARGPQATLMTSVIRRVSPRAKLVCSKWLEDNFLSKKCRLHRQLQFFRPIKCTSFTSLKICKVILKKYTGRSWIRYRFREKKQAWGNLQCRKKPGFGLVSRASKISYRAATQKFGSNRKPQTAHQTASQPSREDSQNPQTAPHRTANIFLGLSIQYFEFVHNQWTKGVKMRSKQLSHSTGLSDTVKNCF